MLNLCCKDRQHKIYDYTVEVYILWLKDVQKGRKNNVPEKTREKAASLETEAKA